MDNYRDETPMTGDYESNDVKTIAEAIRTKKFGKDTREAIAQGLEKAAGIAMESVKDPNSTAKQAYNVGMSAYNYAKNELTARLAQMSNTIKVYPNIDKLKQNYPNGADGIFVVGDTSHKWYFFEGSWHDAGVYTEGLEALKAYGSLFYNQNSATIYSDLNNLEPNKIYTYTDVNLSNSPMQGDSFVITMSYGTDINTMVQFFVSKSGEQFQRVKWNGTWHQWQKNGIDGRLFYSQDSAGDYADLNNLEVNKIYAYSDVNLTNAPIQANGFVTTVSYSSNSSMLQTFYPITGGEYQRIKWGGVWRNWQKILVERQKVTVDPQGNGDFTKVADAFKYAIKHPGIDIYISTGTYDYYTELGSEEYLQTVNSDNHNWSETYMSDVRIYGQGKVIINYFPPKEVAVKYPNAATYTSIINVGGDCRIENLELNVRYCRYAIHDESSYWTKNFNTKHIYKNIKASYLDKAVPGSTGGQALGCGFDNGQIYEFENCQFLSESTVGTSFHNRTSTGAFITFRNCILDGTINSLRLGNVGNQNETNVYLNNCILKKNLAYVTESSSIPSTNAYQVTAIGCNNFSVTFDSTLGNNNKNIIKY